MDDLYQIQHYDSTYEPTKYTFNLYLLFPIRSDILEREASCLNSVGGLVEIWKA